MMTPKITHPALYRVSQFFVALKAYLPAWAGGVPGVLSPGDESLIKSVLPTPAQQQLFARMSPNDRRHALAVARTLQQAGQTDPALMQAALLHDVAKSLGQPIIHRVLIVLLDVFWPAALHRLSNESANGRMDEWTNGRMTKDKGQMTNDKTPFILHSFGKLRTGSSSFILPFIVHAHHPAIGAAWAQEAGCDPLAVKLILKHQDKLDNILTEETKLLAALQWADDLN